MIVVWLVGAFKAINCADICRTSWEKDRKNLADQWKITMGLVEHWCCTLLSTYVFDEIVDEKARDGDF